MTKYLTIDWDGHLSEWAKRYHEYIIVVKNMSSLVETRRTANGNTHVRFRLKFCIGFREELSMRLYLGDDIKRVAEDIRRHEMGKNWGLLFDAKIYNGHEIRRAGEWKPLKI